MNIHQIEKAAKIAEKIKPMYEDSEDLYIAQAAIDMVISLESKGSTYRMSDICDVMDLMCVEKSN